MEIRYDFSFLLHLLVIWLQMGRYKFCFQIYPHLKVEARDGLDKAVFLRSWKQVELLHNEAPLHQMMNCVVSAEYVTICIRKESDEKIRMKKELVYFSVIEELFLLWKETIHLKINMNKWSCIFYPGLLLDEKAAKEWIGMNEFIQCLHRDNP